jgi:predicted DsbA family dithiol-disulfide isomerase
VRVELWVELVCSWCPIGKRHLDIALARFEHDSEIKLVLRSLPLGAGTPTKPDLLFPAYLAAVTGMTSEEVAQRIAVVTQLATKVGLEYRLDRARPADPFDAHRLTHLADRHELRAVLTERLMRGYTQDGVDIANHDTLTELAETVGMDPDEVRTVLTTDAYADAVRAEARRARELRADGTPFLVIEGHYRVSGMRSVTDLLQLLDVAWRQAS